MTEPLTFIVYASRAREPFDHERLVALLTESRDSNARNDITGMLVYRHPDFVQMLEGPDAAVRGLYARIARDPRHSDLRLLLDEPAGERTFSTWSMGHEPTVAGDGSEGPLDELSTDDPSDARRHADDLGDWFRDAATARD